MSEYGERLGMSEYGERLGMSEYERPRARVAAWRDGPDRQVKCRLSALRRRCSALSLVARAVLPRVGHPALPRPDSKGRGHHNGI